MNDFRYCTPHIRLFFTTFRQLFEKAFFILLLFSVNILAGQSMEPETCIKELRKGTLIIRIPTNKAKIDTLTAMSARSTDPQKKERIDSQLNQAIEERDRLFADYITAFKSNFDFCNVGYIFDHEAKDLNTANYYNLDGELISVADLSEKPLYYLYFDRTSDSKIDALVLYNRNIQEIPSPFPNNFSRGGINILFLKLSGKNFPFWRVGKINSQLYKYLERVTEFEMYTREAEKPEEKG
jgi:hypothetical protein